MIIIIRQNEELIIRQNEELERFLQAIERANATSYGLAAGILTKDLQTALQFSQRVEAGSIWVNCYDHTVAHVRNFFLLKVFLSFSHLANIFSSDTFRRVQAVWAGQGTRTRGSERVP